MSRSTLGQVLEPALHTFGDLIADGPRGPGIDFTETNRTRLCQTRFDAFLANPASESFRELWSPATLAGYWMPNSGTLLGPDDEVDACEILLSEMAATDTFDPAWAGQLDGTDNAWGLYELFRRSRGGHEPIPTVEAKRVLTKLGYDVKDTPVSVATAIEEFADSYRDVVGHVSAATEYELPLYAEIDEFFRLVQTTDRETINSQLTGPYAPLFRPLIGHRIHTDSADPLTWSGVEKLIDDHVDARDSGAYDDLETSHWGGTHIESWKWQFKDYFQDVVWEKFDLTALTADDIPELFRAIESPDAEFDAVSNVPAQMMGGRFHRLTWGDIVDYCHENPDQAAAVLSDLFDDDLPVVDRLNEFYEFFHHLTTRDENDRSPGSLLRAATALLMYAFPDRHITFQYQRMDNFFTEYSTTDGLDTGFNAQQYHEVSIACQDLLDRIESRTGDASMIDVQTLIYVADDA